MKTLSLLHWQNMKVTGRALSMNTNRLSRRQRGICSILARQSTLKTHRVEKQKLFSEINKLKQKLVKIEEDNYVKIKKELDKLQFDHNLEIQKLQNMQ